MLGTVCRQGGVSAHRASSPSLRKLPNWTDSFSGPEEDWKRAVRRGGCPTASCGHTTVHSVQILSFNCQCTQAVCLDYLMPSCQQHMDAQKEIKHNDSSSSNNWRPDASLQSHQTSAKSETRRCADSLL